MADSVWTKLDEYFDDRLSLNDADLIQTLAAGEAAGLPQIQVSPALGRLLHLIARIHQCRQILEIGTLAGYSTIWLARALPEGGRLISLELEDEYAQVARKNIEQAGLSDRVTIQVGPAAASLQQLDDQNQGPFDLIFIDADKESCPAYLKWALKLSRSGTVLIIDNVVREGAVADEHPEDASVLGIRQMFDDISNDRHVTATAVQTVGCKGYDGFCLALVEEPLVGGGGHVE